MTREQYTQPEQAADLAASRGEDEDLAHAAAVLAEVETVLISTSEATKAEISDILADHGNLGGIGLLIDQVQFAGLNLTTETH